MKIRLDAEVTDATDIETATIRLKNGEEFKKDFIVASDGVHVSLIPRILIYHTKPRSNPIICCADAKLH